MGSPDLRPLMRDPRANVLSRCLRIDRLPLWGAVVLLITAYFSAGFHHWDEHFQVLEFAGYKLGLTPLQDLPWEYAARIRPALLPFIAFLVHHLFTFFGSSDPFAAAFFLRLLSAALSFTAMMLMVRAFLPGIADERLRYAFVLLTFFTWFAAYDAVRFSSENWSGNLFVIGFALLMRERRRSSSRTLLAAGALFGLAFTVRMQVAFMVLGLLAWLLLIRKEHFRTIVLLAAGLLITVGIGIVIDRWFYGQWTLTAWNAFDVNILQGKASAFSRDPWYTYFTKTFAHAGPPISLVFIAAPLILFLLDRRNVLTWTVLPFVLAHTLIAHKELRFLFPMLGLLPVVIVQALEAVRDRGMPRLMERRAWHISWKVFWTVDVLLLAVVMFRPADAEISLYKTIYDGYPRPVAFYHFGDDPYDRVEHIHFYRRPDLEMAGVVTDTVRFVPNDTILVATKRPADVEERWPDRTLIYSSLPPWVKHFDFNGWLERTDQWYVYQVEP
jgi:phosphatidylinositol glycan class B